MKRLVLLAIFLVIGKPAMAFFTQAELDSVQSDPASISTLYANRQADFQAAFGTGFASVNSDGWKAMFAGLVAYEMKPYGTSTALTLPDLLAEPQLDCDNYLALTYHLIGFLQPTAGFSMAVVGWDNGWVANHAQGITEGTGVPLVIDPTVAVFAVAGFNQVMRGGPSEAVKSFHGDRTEVDWLHGQVKTGLAQGKYNPIDLLYYFDDLDEYIANAGNATGWATPQAPPASTSLTRAEALEAVLIEKGIVTSGEIDAKMQ